MMKRKVEQRETQRAYVHALSYSGSHICEKDHSRGRALEERFATADSSMCLSSSSTLRCPQAAGDPFSMTIKLTDIRFCPLELNQA